MEHIYIHLASDRYTVFRKYVVENWKNRSFPQWLQHHHHATGTSTCPVWVFRFCVGASSPFQDNSPLDRQHITITIHYLLQNIQYNHQLYASHSFRSGAATTVAGAGIPDWLIEDGEAVLTKHIYTHPQWCYYRYQHSSHANIPDTDTVTSVSYHLSYKNPLFNNTICNLYFIRTNNCT